jgi:hypothetical protein
MKRRGAPGAPESRPAPSASRVQGSGPPMLSLVRVTEPESVRWPRVRTARQRIDSGYYEREDVQHLVVNALLNELRRG